MFKGSGEEILKKHVDKLRFQNPGPFMEEFVPEKSTREIRKMNRRIYNQK